MRKFETKRFKLITVGLLASSTMVATTAFAGSRTKALLHSPKPVWSRSIVEGTTSVSDGSKSQTVTFIRVNTHDAHVDVEPVVAGNQFGRTATLAQLAHSGHAVAAINGTFFQSYGDNTPQSTLAINTVYEHVWGPTVLGVAKNGSLKMVRGQEAVYISFGNDSTNEIHAYGINTWRGQNQEIDVLTSFYGPTTKVKNATDVTVQNGVVTAITQGGTAIPKNGYVVVFDNTSAYNQRILSNLKVGTAAGLQIEMDDLATGNPIDFSSMKSAIGSGPMLVDQGRIALNPKLEHLTDPTFLNPVTRRSLLGIDANGNLFLATVRFASIAQLARIAYNLHLKEAMNLDGGSSSGLYFNGNYLLQPERLLSNALTVSYH